MDLYVSPLKSISVLTTIVPQFACVDIPTRLIHVSKIDLMTQTKDIFDWNTFALRCVLCNAEISPFF